MEDMIKDLSSTNLKHNSSEKSILDLEGQLHRCWWRLLEMIYVGDKSSQLPQLYAWKFQGAFGVQIQNSLFKIVDATVTVELFNLQPNGVMNHNLW